jgi:energy-coupling factor transporter ATP-binding protein EcfA2
MSICLNSSLCFDLGSLVAIKNETGVEQAPFSGYVSPWLAGVIISGLMVLWVLLWTILQSTLRERARRKDQRNKIICESQKLEVQFNETCVQMECLAQNRLEKIVGFSESVDSHVSRLNKANRGEPPMQIEFRQLCLKLMNGRGRTILKNVSGVLFASSLTCIMGPSGCGKTTLLTAIAGRTQNGKISGSIKVNDVEQTIERFRTVVGFVPQDDTMIRTLTVRQILTFSAVARLPRSLSMAEKLDVVDSVIAILGLGRIEHQPIGDENMRGISGGQRKRVNIGIELVSAPLALFLDEPTSGFLSFFSFFLFKQTNNKVLMLAPPTRLFPICIG